MKGPISVFQIETEAMSIEGKYIVVLGETGSGEYNIKLYSQMIQSFVLKYRKKHVHQLYCEFFPRRKT
jgi:hypothetical protein